MLRESGFLIVARVVMAMAVLGAVPLPSMAQNLGSGPLTGSLSLTEPTTGVWDLGVVKVAPGLVIHELGRDPNVFDERDDPKEDWVFRGTPDVSVFTGLRFARISAYLGSELAYYQKYKDERAAGIEYRARADIPLSRLTPFIAGGETRKRTRPNGEIDVRADRIEREASGGVAYSLAPTSAVYVSAVLYDNEYRNSVEEGIELSTALNHRRTSYSAGVKTDLTPLAALTVSGGFQEDRFDALAIRDSESRIATVALRIGAEAVLSGNISVSYRDMLPADPAIERNQGVAIQAAVSYPFLEIGRFGAAVNRGLDYSFDPSEAYYVETSVNLSYTHRLFGEVDLQARGSRSLFDYGFREGVVPRRDTLEAWGGSLGYNLRNRTRIALNYEMARRRSPAFAERNYERERVYISWAYAF